jgi:hypothetical protein
MHHAGSLNAITIRCLHFEDCQVAGEVDQKMRLSSNENSEPGQWCARFQFCLVVVNNQLSEILYLPFGRHEPEDISVDIPAKQKRRLHIVQLDLDLGHSFFVLDLRLAFSLRQARSPFQIKRDTLTGG